MKKRSILVLCAVALSISLVGCGGKDKDSSTEGLSEITPTVTEEPIQGYVPPKPNDEKAKPDDEGTSEDIIEDNTEYDANIDTENIEINKDNPIAYRIQGLYDIVLPVKNLQETDSVLYQDGTGHATWIRIIDVDVVDTFNFLATKDDYEGIKQSIKSSYSEYIDKDWETVKGGYLTFEHLAVKLYPSSTEDEFNMLHFYVHKRYDGTVGVIQLNCVEPELKDCIVQTAQQIFYTYTEPTEATTEEQTESTEQVSESTESTESTSSEVEASTETTETQTTE